MAVGQDLRLNFDTAVPAGDSTSYPFGNALPPGPEELSPTGFDFYNGGTGSGYFTPIVNYDLTLSHCHVELHERNQFEFEPDMGSCNYSGSTLALTFTTFGVPGLNHDLNIITNGYVVNSFEYTAPDETHVAYVGSDTTAELEITRRYLWQMSHINLESGDGIPDPCGTDYVFDDLTQKSYVYHGSNTEVDLETDRNVLENDIHICDAPTGATVRLNPIHSNETDPAWNFSDPILDGELVFVFDTNIGECVNPYYNVNRMSMGATSVADLTADKNTNHDIPLCSGLQNPEMTDEDHPYIFEESIYGATCDDVKPTAYHGSELFVSLQTVVFLDNSNGYHGSNGDVDLTLAIQFDLTTDHGGYSDADFSIFPAAKLDMDADHGSNADVDLSANIQFYPDADHGSNADVDLSTFLPAFLETDNYDGSTTNIDLLNAPRIYPDNVQHGSIFNPDLTTFPPILVEGDAYHGSNTDADLYVYATFDIPAEHGSDGDTDLTTAPSFGVGDVNAPHGSNVDGDLATTTTFDVDSYHGLTGDVDVATTPTFNADGYHGAEGDSDLTLNPPKELDSEATHGSNGEVVLGVTKALFPRAFNGAYSDTDLTDSPSIEIGIDGYHGSNGDVDLIESPFNTHGYHGSIMEDVTLQVTVNLLMDEAQHGSNGSVDDLKRAPTLDMESEHGVNGDMDLFVPEGESLDIEAHHGSNFAPSLHALLYAHLEPYPIIAGLVMYDGFAGTGGFNHCHASSNDIHPQFGDAAIRFDYDPTGIDDRLFIHFDEYGDSPWGTCNGGGIRFEWDLQTQPRFEVDIFAGESCEAFVPFKLTPLAGQIPADRLYTLEYFDHDFSPIILEPQPFELNQTAVAWNDPDDVYAFHEIRLDVTLTPTAFSQQYNGGLAQAELSTIRSIWSAAIPEIQVGGSAQFHFEPIEYIRFCKGYIRPSGNAVIFEFSVEEDTCEALFYGSMGQTANVEIMVDPVLNPIMINTDQHMSWNLETEQPWSLWARGGEYVDVENPEVTFENWGHGSSASFEFEVHPYLGYGGAEATFDLIIPGPKVEWTTPEGCLPNEFKPTTQDGDVDVIALQPNEFGFSEYPEVAVEYLPFFANLEANCITFVPEDE